MACSCCFCTGHGPLQFPEVWRASRAFYTQAHNWPPLPACTYWQWHKYAPLVSVMIRNWCCSFIMCSYETVFWLPSFCLVLWRWGWPVKWLNVFLLHTCETAYYNMVAAVKREQHLPGQCSLSAHWTAQTRRPSLSTRGWAGESSRQWIWGKATFDCSSSSQVWVCKHLTLAKVVQHLQLSRRNRPAQFFCSNLAELFVQTGV